MTIDFAYRLVNYVANKEQKGNIKGDEFNLLVVQAQMEVILTFLGPQERLDNRFVPPIGYKVNQQAKEALLPLIVKTPPLTFTDGLAPYPSDYLSFDIVERSDGTPITLLDNDQFGRIKKSLVTPPTAEEPYACMAGNGIEVAPGDLTDVQLIYVKKPKDPNWDYTMSGQTEVYNGTSTPQASGKVSYGFDTPERLHKKICIVILKYIGVNLSDSALTQFATMVQERNP